jgi:hypothetical protein
MRSVHQSSGSLLCMQMHCSTPGLRLSHPDLCFSSSPWAPLETMGSAKIIPLVRCDKVSLHRSAIDSQDRCSICGDRVRLIGWELFPASGRLEACPPRAHIEQDIPSINASLAVFLNAAIVDP